MDVRMQAADQLSVKLLELAFLGRRKRTRTRAALQKLQLIVQSLRKLHFPFCKLIVKRAVNLAQRDGLGACWRLPARARACACNGAP